MHRRRLLQALAAAPLLAAPRRAPAAQTGAAQVAVVGGGFGGLAAAHALRRLLPQAQITLVERRRRAAVAPFSNFALVGHWPLARLQYGYDAVAASGIRVVHAEVRRVQPNALLLADGARLKFDRAIIAPGAAFDYTQVPGAAGAADAMPHAYDGDVQALRQRLQQMPANGVFMIIPPPAPYSCSPAPYDRAGLIADYLLRHKPRGKVLILDQKEHFAQQTLFFDGWNAHYGGQMEWLSAEGGGRLERIGLRTVHTEFGEETADVINYIPPQRAAALARDSGLADASGWCPVHAQTLESKRMRGVYVAGDAAALAPAPKSGSCAMQQGQTAAAALARSLLDAPAAVALPARLRSLCFSHIAPQAAFSEEGVYHLAAAGVSAGHVHLTARHAADDRLKQIARQGVEWHVTAMKELFLHA